MVEKERAFGFRFMLRILSLLSVSFVIAFCLQASYLTSLSSVFFSEEKEKDKKNTSLYYEDLGSQFLSNFGLTKHSVEKKTILSLTGLFSCIAEIKLYVSVVLSHTQRRDGQTCKIHGHSNS